MSKKRSRFGRLAATLAVATAAVWTCVAQAQSVEEEGAALWRKALAMDRKSFDTIDLCGGSSHMQGICVDENLDYMYFSYTDVLAKLDMRTGKVVASVGGFGEGSFGKPGGAHLGCLEYHDGIVYGSLEYKSPGAKFFLAAFDVRKMTRVGMDCKEMKEGVNAILLAEPTYDFRAPMLFENTDSPEGFARNEKNDGHLFACSGIDGVTVGRKPGDASGELYVIVAYGVYGSKAFKGRYDNDYNVLQYYRLSDVWDAETKTLVGTWNRRFTYERGLSTSYEPGELLRAESTLYAWTGNTLYGAQNIEYEWNTGNLVLYTYDGTKGFGKNMYVIDGSRAPELKELQVGQRNDDPDAETQAFAKKLAAVYTNLQGARYFDMDQAKNATTGEYPNVAHAALKCVCGDAKSHDCAEGETWGATGVSKKDYPICSAQFCASPTTGICWIDGDDEGNDYFYVANGKTKVGLYKRATGPDGAYVWTDLSKRAQ